MWVLTPVIFIVNKFSYAVLFILRVDPNRKQEGITKDELRTIVEAVSYTPLDVYKRQ